MRTKCSVKNKSNGTFFFFWVLPFVLLILIDSEIVFFPVLFQEQESRSGLPHNYIITFTVTSCHNLKKSTGCVACHNVNNKNQRFLECASVFAITCFTRGIGSISNVTCFQEYEATNGIFLCFPWSKEKGNLTCVWSSVIKALFFFFFTFFRVSQRRVITD